MHDKHILTSAAQPAAGYTVQAAAGCAYDPQSFEQCGHSDLETQHSAPTMFNPSDVNI